MSTTVEIEILFRDQRFAVVNKPAGLPVHPGPRSERSVEDFFPVLSLNRRGPWLAHRLDTDTSGCLLIALRHSALVAAQAEFAAGRVRKTYWGIVQGKPAGAGGTIDAALAKQNTRQGWRMAVDPAGQRAVTQWLLLAHADGKSLLELRPRTGRTHQLRAHCALIGHPLLGDPIYGPPEGGGGGELQLLSRAIALDLHPPLTATAPPPLHMQAMLASMALDPREDFLFNRARAKALISGLPPGSGV